MKPSSILGKYLIRQTLFNFVAVLLMVMGVIILFELIELLRRFDDNPEISFYMIMELAVTKLPKTVEMVFPFVLMVAGMVTFWKVSRNNEFVIIRASGVSVWGFLTPVLFITFLIGLANLAVFNPLGSRMYELNQTLEYRIDTKDMSAMLFSEKGLWLREAIDEDKFLVLQSKAIRQENGKLFLRDVTILEMDRSSQLLRRIEAFATNLEKDYFDLRDVSVFEASKPVEHLTDYKYKTSLTLSRIKESFIEPQSISFWQLPNTISFYEKAGFSANKHRLRYFSLIASPFLLCAMMLVAAIFALRANNRRGGVLFLIVGGIVTGFIIYFLSQIVYAFGLNEYIPVFLAVWTPTLVVMLVTVSILLHLEEG